MIMAKEHFDGQNGPLLLRPQLHVNVSYPLVIYKANQPENEEESEMIECLWSTAM